MHGNGLPKMVCHRVVIMRIVIPLRVANPILFPLVPIMLHLKKDKFHVVRYPCFKRQNAPRLVKIKSMMSPTKQTNIMQNLFMYVHYFILRSFRHVLLLNISMLYVMTVY